MKAIVIIPTYNEKENINSIIDAVLKVQPDIHILVVDDNSPDGTAEDVRKKMTDNDQIHLIVRPEKDGLGTAYLEGFRYSLDQNFDFIFEMDADFSHNPEDIPRFLEEIKNNDLIIGSRYITGVNVVNWPLSRLILSYGANMYTKIITGLPIKDATGGFKCFRASKLRELNLTEVKTNGYGFQIEINFRMWKAGARIKEIPIIFIDRRSGVSKMNKKIIYEAVFLVWKLKLFFSKKNNTL